MLLRKYQINTNNQVLARFIGEVLDEVANPSLQAGLALRHNQNYQTGHRTIGHAVKDAVIATTRRYFAKEAIAEFKSNAEFSAAIVNAVSINLHAILINIILRSIQVTDETTDETLEVTCIDENQINAVVARCNIETSYIAIAHAIDGMLFGE